MNLYCYRNILVKIENKSNIFFQERTNAEWYLTCYISEVCVVSLHIRT